MSGEIQITIVGNLTSDPELRFTPGGVAVANVTIATTARRFNNDSKEWEDQETTFMRCNIWREYAENAAESLSKGMSVIALGQFKLKTWEDKDGTKRVSPEMDVLDIGPALRWNVAKVSKAPAYGTPEPPKPPAKKATRSRR